MQPISMTLMGFKCFSKQTRFDFPQTPGLYLVSGRNEVQPELEGNGCGKSTLFTDAMPWVFFGKTPRLLKAGDIIHWESTTSFVDLTFLHNGEMVRLVRTQAPNSLSWAVGSQPLQTVSQDQLLDYLDIDFDSFVSSVVFGQFSSTFFDLSPPGKSSLLSNILNLEIWDKASDLAKSASDEVLGEINGLKQKCSHVEGQISALKSMNFDDKITEWEITKEEQSVLLKQQKKQVEDQLEVLAVEGRAYQDQQIELSESLKGVLELKTEVTADLVLLNKELHGHQYAISGLNSKIDVAKKELLRFENVSESCPYCLQPVSESHLKKEKDRVLKTIKTLKKEISDVQELVDEINTSKESQTDSLIEVQQAEKEFNEDLSSVTKQINTLKVSAMSAKKDIDAIKQRLKTLEATKNPYLLEEQQIAEKLKSFDKTLKELQSSVVEKEQTQLNTNYWVKGFRDVRLMLISDVLTQLELEVNNHLYSLGLHDWKVNFAVDGINKGGKIKKGFTVTIMTPLVTEPVPWSAWSGGETQRLRLAGALGMTDLILSKNQFDSKIEVHDEPSQFMSNQGITSLIQVLQDRARSLKKVIFLIDHRYLDSQAFDGSFTVVKTVDGVSVV